MNCGTSRTAAAPLTNRKPTLSIAPYSQLGEVRVRAPLAPKADLPMGFAKLQIVYDQARLVAGIDIQHRPCPGKHDLHVRPCARFEVGVGFVSSGALFS